ncbi:hypothetical protein T08_2842 [Trichinella sp. T8]|nr:hypothetical protein T08_2842 [Trichinella sp. T8]
MFNSWCDEENRNWINLFNSHAQIESDEIELSFSCCLRRRLYIVILTAQSIEAQISGLLLFYKSLNGTCCRKFVRECLPCLSVLAL